MSLFLLLIIVCLPWVFVALRRKSAQLSREAGELAAIETHDHEP